MTRSHRNTIIGSAAALVLVAGGGAAIAANGVLSPQQESDAVVSDAAEQLGVEPSELSEALQQALQNRVDAAVEAGRLTEEQGEQLKARIQAGEIPLLGIGHGGPGHGPGGHLADLGAAASFLGMSEANLRTALQEGQTLAEVAKAQGKSVDGLIQALTGAATERLEEAVADGRLTEAQKDSILESLDDRITDLVNGDIGPRFRGGPGFSPPQQNESSAAFAA